MKILHIFPPDFKTRFGGQVILWKGNFMKWSDENIFHFILDSSTLDIVDAKNSFDFIYPKIQKGTRRIERFFWMFRILNSLYKYRKHYDIIHLHVLWWGGLAAGILANLMGKPIIYESILDGADNPSAVKQESFGKVKLHLFQKIENIIAISPFLADDFEAHDFKVKMIVNPVDTEKFVPVGNILKKNMLREDNGLSINKYTWIFVGSFRYRKGVDILLEAFIDFSKNVSEAQLIIVGPKSRNENPSLDQSYINQVEENIKKYDLTKNIIFPGLVVNKDRLVEFYQMADIFVFPSRQEGLGNVVMEAMSCALPVVTSNLPVLQGIIEQGKNGFMVENSGSLLSNQVSKLYSNPEMSRDISNKARKYVEKNNSFQFWQKEIKDLYINVLNK